jgi:hypothetical protein
MPGGALPEIWDRSNDGCAATVFTDNRLQGWVARNVFSLQVAQVAGARLVLKQLRPILFPLVVGTHAATLRRSISAAQFHGKSLPGLWIVIVDAGEHITEPGLRIDVVELGSLDQGVDDGRAATTFIGTSEGPVLATHRNSPAQRRRWTCTNDRRRGSA